MEPITTTAIISSIVGYLAKTFQDNKTFQDFTKDFTSATVHWIRPLLLQDDDTPKEALAKLATSPESAARRKAVEGLLEGELEDHPDVKVHLEEMYQKLKVQHKQNSEPSNQNYSSFNTGTVIQIIGNNSQFNQK